MQLPATTVKGHQVTNYDNEDLGTIEDFMVDMATGRLGYAIMSCTGMSFIGSRGKERLFAVPIRALTIDPEGGRFMLNADRKMLRYAPNFDRQSWPDTADPRWRSGINSYYSF